VAAVAQPLHVALPTHDGRAEVVTVTVLARDLSAALGRPVQIHVGEASNIPRARNVCLRLAEAASGTGDGTLWLLWVDSDIRLPAQGVPGLARYIARAEAEHVACAAHYRQADGRSTFFLRRGRMAGPALDVLGVSRLPDWAALGMSGFGLLYAPVEPGYVFHADDIGEDIHFWLDHPQAELRYAKGIEIRHHKATLL
jgi:hypothetical protein